MIVLYYKAKAIDGRLLELPEEAQALGIQAGDMVSIRVERDDVETPKIVPNAKALAVLQEIARQQEGQRHTDGSQTERILREGRAGAMYGSEPTE